MVTRTIPLRLDEETILRLDRIGEAFTSRAAGLEVNRSAVMRLALTKGIEFYEEEFDVVPAPKRSKAKKAKR